MSNSNGRVEKFHRINHLKLKAGIPVEDETHGYISPQKVKQAQSTINDQEKDYKYEVESVLRQISQVWGELQDDPNNAEILDYLYNFTNNAKDIAETFDYSLMAHFAHSLRDFCEHFDVNKKEHYTIVQAHIDVMWITFNEDIRGDDSEQAQELKSSIAEAIRIYS